jgi:hypothetical protein
MSQGEIAHKLSSPFGRRLARIQEDFRGRDPGS